MPQGLSYAPFTDQPQQQPSRDQAGGPLGLLQRLLGLEGEPNLPPVQEVGQERLVGAFNDARGIDPERRRQIQQILEGRRTRDDAARGPQPVGPITPGDSSANPEEEEPGFFDFFNLLQKGNPGELLGDAMQDARRRGGVE